MKEIKCTTYIDAKVMQEWATFYYQYVSRHMRTKSLYTIVVLAVIGILLMGRVNGIIDIIAMFLIVMSIYLLVIIQIRPRLKLNRPIKNFDDFQITYTFYHDGFDYESKQQLNHIQYDDVTFIYDLDKYLYFYMANRQGAYIVDWNAIDAMEQSKLRSILQKYSSYQRI